MMTVGFRLSEHVFLYPDQGGMILWNAQSHDQYRLEPAAVAALARACSDGDVSPSACGDWFTKFRDAGVIVDDVDCGDHSRPWPWDKLSQVFHEGTKDIPIADAPGTDPESWVEEYLEYCAAIGDPPEETRPVGGEVFQLPEPETFFESVSLGHALRERKTARSFSGDQVSLDEFSSIMYGAFGRVHGDWDAEFRESGLQPLAIRKAMPSGGGLHPVRAYALAAHVDGLPPAIYSYDDATHSVTRLRDLPSEQALIELLCGQYYASGIAFGTFLTARMDLAAWKYHHSRAYRNVLLDVGHVSQTFLLAATARGLQTWLTGAFLDSDIEDMLGVDGRSEAILFFVAAGHGTADAFDRVMRKVVRST